MKKSELKAMSLTELRNLKKRIEEVIADVESRDRAAALKKVEAQAKSLGFSLSELVGGRVAAPKRGRKAKAAPKKAGVPKYANPADKSQTWTGKGRRPGWVLSALAAGKSLDDLAI